MHIVSAKYHKGFGEEEVKSIIVVTDTLQMAVPLDPSNSDYIEIMRLVDAGELVIQEPSE